MLWNLLAQADLIPIGGGIDGIRGQTDAYLPGNNSISAAESLEKILSNVIGIFTVFAGMGFILFFAFGAIQWILAQGDEGKVSSARKQMTNGVVGLLVTVLAYVFVAVVGAVVGIDILNPAALILDNLNPNNL
jgi:hypothetical protein